MYIQYITTYIQLFSYKYILGHSPVNYWQSMAGDIRALREERPRKDLQILICHPPWKPNGVACALSMTS